MSESLPFTINVTGDASGEQYKGTFKAKTRLSHRDELRRDELRRKLLGENPAEATPRAKSQATVLAELAVRLTDTPKWWSTVDGGLDLEDDNVLAVIWEECQRLEKEQLDKVKAEAAEAKDELRKLADSDSVG